jgi:hypothetical protein
LHTTHPFVTCDVNVNSAYTYQLTGEKDLAMSDLQAAIALPPTDKEALKQVHSYTHYQSPLRERRLFDIYDVGD